jgi:hypothetical protein
VQNGETRTVAVGRLKPFLLRSEYAVVMIHIGGGAWRTMPNPEKRYRLLGRLANASGGPASAPVLDRRAGETPQDTRLEVA